MRTGYTQSLYINTKSNPGKDNILSGYFIFEEAASMRVQSVHSPVEEKGPLALASEHLFT